LAKNTDENTIYTSVSNPLAFPGGLDCLQKYLSKNVIYPSEQIKKHIGGNVIISFVIKKDATLTDIKLVRSPDASLGEEAIRVIQSTKFINGSQNGKPVRVSYYIRVKFDPEKPKNHELNNIKRN
jgi:periplasmic protein TonB